MPSFAARVSTLERELSELRLRQAVDRVAIRGLLLTIKNTSRCDLRTTSDLAEVESSLREDVPRETSENVPARQYLVMERELHNLAAVTTRYLREIRMKAPALEDLSVAAEIEVINILRQLPPDPRQRP